MSKNNSNSIMNRQLIAAILRSIHTLFSDSRQVVLREIVNMDVLKQLCARYSGVNDSDKKKLRSYLAMFNQTSGEGKETVYTFTPKDRNSEKAFGRLHASTVSLQSLKKSVYRNPLTHGILLDIDMRAAQPSIFRGVFAHYNVHSAALDLYVSDRDAALVKYGLKDKQEFISILNCEFLGREVHPEIAELHRIIFKVVYPQVATDFPQVVKFCKKRGEQLNKGSVMSNLFQAIESVILMNTVDFMRAKYDGLEPAVLMYDGFMVKRDDRINAEFLDALAKNTLDTTGFEIKWTEKPIPVGVQPKGEFDDFCESPSDFVAKKLESGSMYQDAWAMKVFGHMMGRRKDEDRGSWARALTLYVGEFVRKDLSNGEFYYRRSTDRKWALNISEKVVKMVFNTKLTEFFPQVNDRIFDLYKPMWGEASDDHLVVQHYNCFHGFAASRLDRSISEDEIKPFLDYIKDVVCCGRDREYMYVLKWIQGLLTTGRANGVILLLVGLEGAGKGFLYKMLSKFIIGEEYCTTINDINKFVKGEFNSQIENKILVLFDEMAAPSEKEQKMVFDVIKNMTTDDQIVINEKYVKKYIVLNMNNFMVATNNNDAVALTKTGRRTFVNRVSNKHRNKKQFFIPLSDFIEQNADAILTYLLDLDLDHIELADFPRNEDRNAMVEASMDPASALIEDIIEYGGFPKGLMGKGRVETLQEMEVRELYEMFCEYVHSRFPGRIPKSMKWFGIAMTNAVHPDENGPLFEKADKRIEGRVCRIYVYKGPQLLDAMDES